MVSKKKKQASFPQRSTRHPRHGRDRFDHFWTKPFLANPFLANPILHLVCVMVGPHKVGPKPRKNRAPKGGAQNFALFFLFPPEISLFVLSLGVFSCNFWWSLKRRSPPMCAFGVLWLSCETPAVAKPPGFLHGSPTESPNVHI